MQETIVRVETKDGIMPAFVVRPKNAAPCHLVIQYMDVWGVREELYDIARRIAAFGYVCAVPDLYYRWGEIRTNLRDLLGTRIEGGVELIVGELRQSAITEILVVAEEGKGIRKAGRREFDLTT